VRVASVNQDPGIAPGRKKGAAVHVAAMRRAFEGHGAEVVAVDEREGRQVALRLEEASLSGPLDLVYERLSLGASAAVKFAQDRSIPYVVEVNAPLLDEAVRWRGEVETADLRAAEELSFASAAAVIAVSSEVARYAVDRGAPPSRVHVFQNGGDLQEFHPGLRTKMRAELVPEGRFVLGFHGRLRPWHGFDRLVEVFGELLEGGEPVHLVLVGEGDFDEVLKDRIPADRVTRVGWVDHEEVGSYVATFDALPLTYAPDTPCYFSPLKLTEAMACGVVPLVPQLGDLTTVVEDGVSGIVYDGSDLSSLRSALERLIHDLSLRKSLSQQAVRCAESHSWARIAEFVLENGQTSSGTGV